MATTKTKKNVDEEVVLDIDQLEDETAPAAVVEEDVIAILEPRSEPVDILLSYGGIDKVYTQSPLTYFRKMEFFGLLGQTIDDAMKGDDGLTVNSLMGAEVTSVNDLTTTDFADLDSFMNLAAKIAHYAPDFLKECYIVWLNIPKGERAWAREALDYVEDEIGLEIVERFIDQNLESIESFFTVRVPALLRRVQARRTKSESQQ